MIDLPRPGTFLNMKGWDYRQEGAATSRFGREAITVVPPNNVPIPGSIHTLGRLKSLAGIDVQSPANPTSTYRYAAAGTTLYRRRGDTQGAYSTCYNGFLNGTPLQMVEYRPDFSSVPYIFFADTDAGPSFGQSGRLTEMLKDRGDGSLLNVQRWGILPPTRPATVTVGALLKTDIDLFNHADDYAYSNITSRSFGAKVNTTFDTAVATTGIVEATPADMTNIVLGAVLSISGGTAEEVVVLSVTATTFFASFSHTHAVGEVIQDLELVGVITPGAPIYATGTLTCTANFIATETVVVGGVTYTFVAALSGDPYEVLLGANLAASLVNLNAALNAGTGAGSTYGAGTVANPSVTSTNPSGTTIVVTAIIAGTPGNSIDTTETGANASWGGATLAGGLDITGTASLGRTTAFDFTSVGGVASSPTDIFSLIMRSNTPATLINARITFFTSGSNYYYIDFGNTPWSADLDWSLFRVSKGSFNAFGTPNWANITSWQISFAVGSSDSLIRFGDFYFMRIGGPDSSAGGTGYDYRFIYRNNITGAKSSPSVAMVQKYPVINQQLVVSWTTPIPFDSQVTHVRIYRRGGSLTDAWRQVADIPIFTVSTFVDTLSDSDIENNEILELDNDPPVTSALRVPVNTVTTNPLVANTFQAVIVLTNVNMYLNQYVVIQDGIYTETVVVEVLELNGFGAYCQYQHSPGVTITASARIARPANLCATAFERAWVAGDPDNPNILYYSKKQRPESFPPQNQIEVGTPDDPIMAVIEFAGQLYVATFSHWYNIVLQGAGLPFPYPAASRHGLRGTRAWTKVEREIWFMSEDGLRSFAGQDAPYQSEAIEWIPQGRQILTPVDVFDTSQYSEVILSYNKNEVFVSYIGQSGEREEIIYSLIYKRWRNSDRQATAMIYEDDTGLLIFGDDDGMIWQDLINDYDDGGYSGGQPVQDPINLLLEWPFDDEGLSNQKKVYNELTLDIDTGGQDITVGLSVDNVFNQYAIGTVNTASRQQVTFPLLSASSGPQQGQPGIEAYNQGLVLSGAVIDVVTMYKYFLRATVEPELRKSFDTYISDFGVNQWKSIKQAWFNYKAPDAAGVTFGIYTDENVEIGATPDFTFTLPQATVRRSLYVRFPATKFKLIRMLGASPTDFQIWPESFVEWKACTQGKGYEKLPFQELVTIGKAE